MAMAEKNNKSGMTIIEVVIAMTIIAISSAIMCTGISTSLSIIRKSADMINNNAENKSSLLENIADSKTENIKKSILTFNSKDYDIYEIKAENDSGELIYYSANEATLNTRGMLQCFIETFEKLSGGSISGVTLTKNSIDSSENSNASNAFIDYLNDTYGIDAGSFYWRIVKDTSDGTYKIALTDELKPLISDGSFVEVDVASVKIGSTNYSNIKSGYCQFKTVTPSDNSFNGGNDYLILNTVVGSDVDVDSFLTKDDFNITKNGSVIFNLFEYLCVTNNYTGDLNSNNCSEVFADGLKKLGIDASEAVFSLSFNSGEPIITYCVSADKTELKENDYVSVKKAVISGGSVEYSSGFTKAVESGDGIMTDSELKSTDVFEDEEIFTDSGHAVTIKNMFTYFMLEKRIDSSVNSENASDSLNEKVKNSTGIDSENSLWLVTRDSDNDNLIFKYSTVLPLSQMKYGDNYKKYADILVRTISAEYNYDKNKWTYTNGYSQLKYEDGKFVLGEESIELDSLSDDEAMLISAIANGLYQNGNPEELDGESGYTEENGERTVNDDSAAGKIIKGAINNFNVDLDKYYWRVSDGGDFITFVKKSAVLSDSEGNPDTSQKVTAVSIKISKLKKEEQEISISLINGVYVLNS